MVKRLVGFAVLLTLAAFTVAAISITKDVSAKKEVVLQTKLEELASLRATISVANLRTGSENSSHIGKLDPDDFLSAGSERTGVDDLRRRVFGLVKKHQGKIVGADTLSDLGTSSWSKIQVDARLNSAFLKEFLEELETGRPLLVIDRFSTDAESDDEGPGSSGAGRLLNIQMTVRGLVSFRPNS